MTSIFRKIQILKETGKLHTRLLTRTRILFGIAILLSVAVLFNVLFRGTSPYLVGVLFIIGFIFGMFVFSKMTVVNWNEDDEVLVSGRLDTIGYISIVVYILFEIGLRTVISEYFPTHSIPLLLAAIGGTILGRAIGTLFEIHRVYVSSH